MNPSPVDSVKRFLEGDRNRALVLGIGVGALIILALGFLLATRAATAQTPDVVGQGEVEAGLALSAAGFVAVTTDVFTADAEPGIVVSQSPGAGASAEVGSEVVLLVARGSGKTGTGTIVPPPPAPTAGVSTAIPDVTGVPQGTAEATLVASGYVSGTISARSDALLPVGTVISQEPAAGSFATPGAAVNLVVSAGNVPVLVPDLACVPTVQALNQLTSLGLPGKPTGVEPSARCTATEDVVVRQDPLPGVSVPPGTAVSVWTSQVAATPTPSSTAQATIAPAT